MPPSINKESPLLYNDEVMQLVEEATTTTTTPPSSSSEFLVLPVIEKQATIRRGGGNAAATNSITLPDYNIQPDDGKKKSTTTGHCCSAAAGNTKSISSCLFYSFCSIGMILVNKSLAGSGKEIIHCDMSILLVVFQAMISATCVVTCKRCGWIEYPPLSIRTFGAWAPVNVLFCLMLITGMSSLRFNTVPMVTVFKNVTNVLITAGDYVFFGNKCEWLVLLAFGIMLTGAIAAAWNDGNVTVTGALWMASNCLSTSGYVLYMKHATTRSVHMSKFAMVICNNILSVAFLFPIAYLSGHVSMFVRHSAVVVRTSTTTTTVDYYYLHLCCMIVLSGSIGFFLNFASFACVEATGPTTYAIVGSLNKVPVSILGYLIFDDVISGKTWFFIAVSMCGGFLYSCAKIRTSATTVK